MSDADVDKFIADIEKFNKITWNKVNLIIKSISADLFTSIIKDCPVDSGRAQNSWNFSVGSPNYKTLGKGQYDKTGAVKERTIINELKRAPVMIPKGDNNNQYYLANGLPYISMLEYGLYTKSSKTGKTVGGFSSQAVGGFVRKNLQKFSKKNFTQYIIKG
jgi:hypothetical protein